jgi:hypothetical protein
VSHDLAFPAGLWVPLPPTLVQAIFVRFRCVVTSDIGRNLGQTQQGIIRIRRLTTITFYGCRILVAAIRALHAVTATFPLTLCACARREANTELRIFASGPDMRLTARFSSLRAFHMSVS